MRTFSSIAVVVLGAALSVAIATGAAAKKRAPTGRIAGVVHVSGHIPARTPLDRRADPFCAQHRQLSAAVIADGGKLRDVFVGIATGQISGSNGSTASARATAPATITQTGCMYQPRVIGVLPGQAIAISNGDATLHNVHAYDQKRTLFNLAQPPRSPAVTRHAPKKAGEIVTLKCDVHPWMRAYAVVTDNPHFAVTGDGGTFSIDHVPPGTYRIEAWHPVLGKQTAQVKVRAGKTAHLELTFEAR